MANPSIDEYGHQHWFNSDGQRHRDDGPAIIYADGHQIWYQHDHIHRDDGPAVMRTDGRVDWWMHSEVYYFEDWLLANTEISAEEKVMLKLQYG